jgi:uncharacterized protein (TIGR02145 family)
MLMLLIYSVNITAQVTIGSDQPPRAGAGLDLRSSDKGLLLPNVALSDPATDFQLDGGAATTATGMVVYNTSEELDGPGVYVWDGNRWILITCVPETPGTIEFSETAVIQNGTFTASVPEVTGPAAPTAYIWSVPAGEMEITGANNGRTIAIKANAVNTYAASAITVQATNACGTSAPQVSLQTITVRNCTAAPAISFPATGETKITKQGVALPADLSVIADGKGETPAYRWESSADLLDWNPVNDETSAVFMAPVTSAGTVYYRCVVTTNCGDATSPVFTVIVCPAAVKDNEENWYCTGDFGAAGTWMTMSLRSTRNNVYDLTRNGAPGSDTSRKYYWYPGSNSNVLATTADDILDTHPEYGLLYTWAAASGRTEVDTDSDGIGITSGSTNHQGICPDGWHLPSDYEWNQLEKVIAESAEGVYSTTGTTTWQTLFSTDNNVYRGDHGRKMKSQTKAVATTAFSNPNDPQGLSKGFVTNGFDALLVGRMESSSANAYGMYAGFWSSSSNSSSNAWRRDLYYNRTGVGRNRGDKYVMGSVRCRKDYCTAAPTISSPAANETKITQQEVALPAALSVTADGKGVTPAYQWQSSADLSTWTDIAEETAAVFTAPVDVAGTVYYQCVVTTSCGSATSAIFTVYVCGTAVQDSDENWYCTGDFGDAGEWMTMSLRSTQTYHGGTQQTIPQGINAEDANSAYYYYPNADETILTPHPEYGLLYTWAAANTGADPEEESDAFAGAVSTRQGICPAGWHVPSDYEWNELEREIATNPGKYSSQTTPYAGAGSFEYDNTVEIRPDSDNSDDTYWGRQMKSTTGVNDYWGAGTSKSSTANGLDALLVGYMYSGLPSDYGAVMAFWSSSTFDVDGSNAWLRVLSYYYNGSARLPLFKYGLCSVRCRKDCTAEPEILSPASNETRLTQINVALPEALSVTADGKGVTPAYQWQSSADLTTWTDIAEETAAAFTAPVDVAGTVYYQCVVTTSCGSATSAIFMVNVCGTFVEDSEDNLYCTGDFGDAGEWMTMNLRSTTNLMENGAPGTDTSNKYYWYPGSNSSVAATTADDILDTHPEYGLLYTWAAASGRTGSSTDSNGIGTTPGSTHYQGICPDGWHLPSDYEWNQLEKVIAESGANVYSTTGTTAWEAGYSTAVTSYRGDHAPKMKSRTAATSGTSNGLAANGFDALLLGYIENGSAGGYGSSMSFWSSSSNSSSGTWRRYLGSSNPGVYRSSYNKYTMFSVRCRKDCMAAPTISSPASDETKITKTGEAVSNLSVTADGKGATPAFQWQSSANLSDWANVGSATDAAYTAPVDVAGTVYYRCVVTTGCGNATSKVFTVNVCGTAIQDSEGNWYCTGNFDNAGEWMTTNLRTKSGLTENGAPGVGVSRKYYWYPGQNSSVTATTADDILDAHPEYGLLYTWAAATDRTSVTDNNEGNTSHGPHQGICPADWHLPSDFEWSLLEQVIAESAQGVYSTTATTTWNAGYSTTSGSYRGTHGQKMKSRTAVNGQTTSGTSNGLAANGFDALLTGHMYSGSATSYGTHTYFWSSSSANSSYAWNRSLNFDNTGVYRNNNTAKYTMLSVRCKKGCWTAPTISSPASDETKITKQGVALPTNLSVTANIYSASSVTFQWQSSATGTDSWTNVGSATDVSYTAPVNVAGTVYYRCVVTTGCGSVTSKIFTVNVCGTSVEDSEGNWYCTGDFGTAGTWMTMNLRSTSGLTANSDSGSDISLKYYWYSNNSQSTFSSHPEYGLLYTWAAANIGTSPTEDSDAFSETVSNRQGICPSGWHLPSDYEWNQLEEVIAKSGANVYSTSGATGWESVYSTRSDNYRGNHGQKMKSTTAVDSKATNGTSNSRTANGFDALLVGYRYSIAAIFPGTITYFWSSSSYDSSNAWNRILTNDQTGVNRKYNSYKAYMSSVRCKMNNQ